jgi:tetratricopeptide (TPR) repeat protein
MDRHLLRGLFLGPASAALLAACGLSGAVADTPDRGQVLQLPGLPPIPMPPGARVYGPNGDMMRPADRPQATPQAPAAATPAPKAAEARPDITQPAGRRKILDDLFGRLGKAQDGREATGIVSAIERVWMHSGSDTADLIMARAVEAMETKDWNLTRQLLDKVVVVDPDWAEGWNKRATARFFADDFNGAMEDIAHTLALEPRHFGALTGLGSILQKAGMDKGALEAFRKALEINPQQEDIRKIVDKLTVDVEGRDI